MYIITTEYDVPPGRSDEEQSILNLVRRQVDPAAVCLGSLSGILDRQKQLGKITSLSITSYHHQLAPYHELERYYCTIIDTLYAARNLFVGSNKAAHRYLYLVLPGNTYDLHQAFLLWQIWRQPAEVRDTATLLINRLGDLPSREEALLAILSFMWRRAQGAESAQYTSAARCVAAMTSAKTGKYGKTITDPAIVYHDVLAARRCASFVPSAAKGKAAAVQIVSLWLDTIGSRYHETPAEVPQQVLAAAKKLLPPPQRNDERW